MKEEIRKEKFYYEIIVSLIKGEKNGLYTKTDRILKFKDASKFNYMTLH